MARAVSITEAPEKPPLGLAAAFGVVVAAGAGAVAWIVSSAVLAMLAMLVMLVGTAAVVVYMQRHWQQRRQMPALLMAAWSEVLGVRIQLPLIRMQGFTWGSLMKAGPPRQIKLQDPMQIETPRAELEAAASVSLGATYRLDKKRSKRAKWLVFRIVKDGQEQEQEPKLGPREALEKRISAGARGVLGETAKVSLEWDSTEQEPDYLVSVDITGFDGTEIALPGKRNQALSRLRSRLPHGNFTQNADPQGDWIGFARAKPLPKLVLPPARQAPQIRTHEDYRKFEVPVGLSAGGGVATWPLRKLPHYLGIGGTGGGKTIWEHGLIQALTQAGCRVWLLDGKRVEFLGYKDWPNVEFLAQTIEDQVRLLHLAHEIMMTRYELIQSGKATVAEMDEIILIADEMTTFKTMAEQLYRRTKEKGMPSKSEIMDEFGNLLRLARTCKIHLAVGMQRPDTTIIDGESRDNMGNRISLGPLASKEGSMMMWDNAAIGVQIPRIPGRAIGLVDGVPTQIQATLNANPDRNHDDYHAGMVAAARPKESIYTRKYFEAPATGINDETGEETPAMWTDILNTRIVDETGAVVELNPVMTEESKAARSRPAVEDDRPYGLQVASDMSEIDELFDPLMAMRWGRSVVEGLQLLFPAKRDAAGSKVGRENESMPAAQTAAMGAPEQSYAPCRVEDLAVGDRAEFETIGQVLMISEIERSEDDPELMEIVGYTDDGELCSVEIEGTVEVPAATDDELVS